MPQGPGTYGSKRGRPPKKSEESGFKMRGNPMQRNFGIGSPTKTKITDHPSDLGKHHNKLHDDGFFEKNPDGQVIAFDSGAKKHRKIRKNDKDEWTDTFKSFDLNSRFSKEGKSDPLYSLLDRSELTSLNVENRSVVQASWDGTYNGTLYSGPGSAKITTPMGAFLSPAAKESYHKWARKDAVEGFSNVIHWMKPENSGKRIQDAQQNMFNITSDHKGYSGEIFSFQKIWVKAGGDPLTSWMRDTYTSYLKNKFNPIFI